MSYTKNSSTILNEVIVSRKHILEMLKCRDYDISKYENQSHEELKILIANEDLDMELENTQKKQLYVKYLILNKIKNTTLEKEINELILNRYLDKNNEDFDLIFIIKDRKTVSLQKVIDSYIAKKYNIQVFWIKNLLYNVLEHDSVPKHRIITNEECIELKKKYNIQKNGMPLINRNDPVAQYLGMLPGNICEITRKSETSGEYLTYRLCY